MTPQQLRNSILQMAIEGKLTKQLPEDGNAADLLKQIKAEKAKLIKEKKIKNEKPLPEITEDEIPFVIPDNWIWTRLGEITSKIGAGSTPSGGKTAYQEFGIKFLRSQNIYNDGLHFTGIVYIPEKINNQKSGSIVFPKDILLNITGGSIGRCSIVPDDFDIANINQHILIIRNIEERCRHYVHKVLISPYIQTLIMSVQVGVSRKGLSAEKTKNFLIPLPPIEEQKRIITRLEKILIQIEAYEKIYNELQKLNKTFPVNLKNSLLQMAIKGKLVEQRSEDGNAAELLKEIKTEKEKLIKEKKIKKEKPLPEITEDEIPFMIPDNWCWIRLNDIVIREIKRGKSPVYSENGDILVFAQKCNTKYSGINISLAKKLSDDVIHKYSQDEFIQNEDIIINSTGTGTLGRVGIYLQNRDNKDNFKLVPDSHVTIIRVSNMLYSQYIYWIVKNMQIYLEKQGEGSTKQKELKPSVIKCLLLTLPPIGEQKRIVSKLEQILPLCNELMKQEYFLHTSSQY